MGILKEIYVLISWKLPLCSIEFNLTRNLEVSKLFLFLSIIILTVKKNWESISLIFLSVIL